MKQQGGRRKKKEKKNNCAIYKQCCMNTDTSVRYDTTRHDMR